MHQLKKVSNSDVRRLRRSSSRTQTVNLHSSKKIEKITNNVFPWTPVATIRREEIGVWPYVLQPQFKPKKNEIEINLTSQAVQTGKDIRSSIAVAISEENENVEYNFQYQKEDKEKQKNVSSVSSEESNIDPEDLEKQTHLINENLVHKNQVPKSKENLLPRFVADKSPYVTTKKYELSEQVLPTKIDLNTIIQMGKPWHKVDKCKWLNDVVRMATLSPTGEKPEKDPEIDWGESLTSLQKRLFNDEYQGRKKRNINIITKKKTTYQTFLKKIIDLLALMYAEVLENQGSSKLTSPHFKVSSRPPLIKKKSSKIGTASKAIFLPQGILTRSYSPINDKKYKHDKPNVDGIDKIWLYLTKRKWPPNIVRTSYFKNMVRLLKGSSPKMEEALKVVYLGEWPYINSLVKQRPSVIYVPSTKIKIDDKDILKVDSQSDVRKRRSFQAVSGSYMKIRKQSRETIACKPISDHTTTPTKETKQTKTLDAKVKAQSSNEPFIQLTTCLPHPLINQGKFGGHQLIQEAFIDTQNIKAQFKYKLSDLNFYRLKYTHLLEKRKYVRQYFYYAQLAKNKEYPFAAIFDRSPYTNGNICLKEDPLAKTMSIYYPSKKEAIRCTRTTYKFNKNLLIFRFTIFENSNKNRVLAIFDTLGNGIVYDKRGKIRLNFSQKCGISFETKYGRPFKWQWHNIPIPSEHYFCRTDSLDNLNCPTTEMDDMVMRQINLFEDFLKSLTQKKTLDSDINFESNKLAFKTNGEVNWGFFTPLIPFSMKINEEITLNIREQKNVLLKFVTDNKRILLNIGIVLKPNVILKITNNDWNLVMNQNIFCPFDFIAGQTSSLLNILKSIGNGHKVDVYLNSPTQLIQNFTGSNLLHVNSQFNLDLYDTKKLKETTRKSPSHMSVRTKLNLRKKQKISKEEKIPLSTILKKEDTKLHKTPPPITIMSGSKPVVTDIIDLINNRTILQRLLNKLISK